MGLFDKKYCDVCGEKIGLFGNRKLEDGNLCKNCAKKLSPWFDERRHSTVGQIKEQLDYRENNKAAVSAFSVSRSFGEGSDVFYIDENARKFCVSNKNFAENNPDILDFSQLKGIDLDLRETKHELKRTVDGKSVSYAPPRYEYFYDFHVKVRVEHPYFAEMNFKLNNYSVKMGEHRTRGSWGVSSAIDGLKERHEAEEYSKFIRMGEELKNTVKHWNTGGTAVQPQSAVQTAGCGYALQGNTLMFDSADMDAVYFDNLAGIPIPVNLKYSGSVQTAAPLSQEDAEHLASLARIAVCQELNEIQKTGIHYDQLPKNAANIAQSVFTKNIQRWSGAVNGSITAFTISAIAPTPEEAKDLERLKKMAGLTGTPTASAPRSASSEWVCPTCTGKNPASEEFCQYCGTPRG